jgi:hypothetical protein
MFEWAWHQAKPIREIDEARDSQYNTFRRWDVKNWKKWKFYFGAVTVLPLRMFISLLLVLLVFIFVR